MDVRNLYIGQRNYSLKYIILLKSGYRVDLEFLLVAIQTYVNIKF